MNKQTETGSITVTVKRDFDVDVDMISGGGESQEKKTITLSIKVIAAVDELEEISLLAGAFNGREDEILSAVNEENAIDMAVKELIKQIKNMAEETAIEQQEAA